MDEFEIEWWSPPVTGYDEKRTVELIVLFQAELKNARAELGESRIGYNYSDNTILRIFWESSDSWGEETDDSEPDVVYRLEGDGFNVECRMTGPMADDDTMLYDYSWGDIIEDYLWIDGVDGDELAKVWLRNPPGRSIIDPDTYLGPRPAFPSST